MDAFDFSIGIPCGKLCRWMPNTVIFFVVFLGAAIAVPSQTFENPLFSSQDPYVTFWQGSYYYTESGHNQIRIRRAQTLIGLRAAKPEVAWTSPWVGFDGRANIWAPEIHQVGGRWYIYYAADFRSDGRHRLFVVQGGADPMDPYEVPDTGYPRGQIAESTGKWAIDPNVFYGADGQLYITWSCTGDDVGKAAQNLCLARMGDALHISSATLQVSRPEESWETRTGYIQEGPVGFVHDGKTYLTYSASANWTPNDYTVGVLLNSDGNLLDAKSWSKHGPIFDHHGTAYGPGSVVFVPSPDGTELWNVYHAYDRLDCAVWACRTIRMQKVEWDAGGLPLLGYPTNPGISLQAPSGEMGSLSGWGNSPSGAPATGAWRYTGAESLDTLPGGEGMWQTFRDNSNPISYMTSAQVQYDGGTAQFGVYAGYRDANNHLEGYLDSRLNAFVSSATIAGAPAQDRTIPLPVNFDFSAPHTILISKSGAGEYAFSLDGEVMDQRSETVDFGHVGVFSNSTGVHFRNVTLRATNFGWGDAFGDAAEGLPRSWSVPSSGFARGNWSITDAATVESANTGSNWDTLYQGNPNFSRYSVQVNTRVLENGIGDTPPSYGLIVCHDDRNNQLTLWIDAAQNTLAWKAVVKGQASSQSVALPAGFDTAGTHMLSATKSGSSFTFLLDGNELAQVNLELLNGSSGVVSQNARVWFDSFTILDR
jgi:GH43 family beta-xylosidase